MSSQTQNPKILPAAKYKNSYEERNKNLSRNLQINSIVFKIRIIIINSADRT